MALDDDFVLISAGSNGYETFDVASHALLGAQKALGEGTGAIVRASRTYRTPAFPAGSGPDFANAVFALHSTMPPDELLALLHRIEADAGRVRVKRWGQRTLDLDLLAVADLVLPDRAVWTHWAGLPLERQMQDTPDRLILPHPRLADRAFVLVPMMDVAPGWVHPVTGASVAQMLSGCDPADIAGILPVV